MKTYIGTKIVEAEPAKRYENGVEFVVVGDEEITSQVAHVINTATSCAEGYRVRYQDGYTSWSPKDVFDRAYLPLEPNPNLKTASPSISAKMVEDFILETWTQTAGKKTTIVRAMLKNGYEIVEASSCVSPENYDEAMGREICMKKIRDKVWALLGFLLQTAVQGVQGFKE